MAHTGLNELGDRIMRTYFPIVFWTLLGGLGFFGWLSGYQWGFFLFFVSLASLKDALWPEGGHGNGKDDDDNGDVWITWDVDL